ncbi:hypothetical protein [Larkinella sp. C7]|jgi:hypothetical protein|uniref:hypothetical protein n=1 Tax=Larkinella sp. C7 TaxID=2576607 RepID=UPI0011115C9F|nr:hypothetical protein [Larkinella sp. C7]
MQPKFLQSLDLYIDLLTPEGYDNYFRQFERELVLGIEEYSEILKIDKPNGLIITRDLIEFESVDNEGFNDEFADSIPLESGSSWLIVNNYFNNYIEKLARLAELNTQHEFESEVRQDSTTGQVEIQAPFLLGYMTLLYRLVLGSSFNYKTTLLNSLSRLDQSIKRTIETTFPEIIDSSSSSIKTVLNENRLEKQWVEPVVGFTIANITLRQLKKCIDAVYEDLDKHKLLVGNVKVLFKRAFSEPLPKKIIWKSTINNLHNLILTLIDAGMIVRVNHWHVTAACFKRPKKEFDADDIMTNSHKAVEPFKTILEGIDKKLRSIIHARKGDTNQATPEE